MEILQQFLTSDIRSNKLHKKIAQEAIHNPEILDEVSSCLFFEKKVVRAAAAGTFAEMTATHPELGTPYIAELTKALLNSPEPQTRWESINALGNIGAIVPEKVQDIIPQISESMQDKKSACVRGYALIALGQIGGSNQHFAEIILPYLLKAMELFDGTNDVGYVIEALAKVGVAHSALVKQIEPIIRPFLKDKSPAVVKKTKRALKSMGLKG